MAGGGQHSGSTLDPSCGFPPIEYYDIMHGSAALHVANAKTWLMSELGTAYKDREWRVVVDPEWDEKGKESIQLMEVAVGL